jgi:hypothetical protein
MKKKKKTRKERTEIKERKKNRKKEKRRKSVMLISTAWRIYKRPFLSVTSSIPVNQCQSQSEFDLPTKSKIGKNNGVTDGHISIDSN